MFTHLLESVKLRSGQMGKEEQDKVGEVESGLEPPCLLEVHHPPNATTCLQVEFSEIYHLGLFMDVSFYRHDGPLVVELTFPPACHSLGV